MGFRAQCREPFLLFIENNFIDFQAVVKFIKNTLVKLLTKPKRVVSLQHQITRKAKNYELHHSDFPGRKQEQQPFGKL